MKEMDSNTQSERIVVNLQLFAEPATDVQAPVEHPELSVDEKVAALFNAATGNEQPTAQDQITQPTIEQPTMEQPVTESVQSIDTPQDGNGEVVPVQRYKDAQAWGTVKSQEAAELRKQNEQLAQQLQQLTQQSVQQPVQTQVQTQVQEDLTALDPQSFIDKFYENPQAALQEIVGNLIKPVTNSPAMDYLNNQMKVDKWGNALKQFKDATPDYAENEDAMFRHIADNNLGNSDDPDSVLKDAYINARRLNYQPPQAPIDPKSYLDDPNFQAEIANNPTIRDMILKQQMQSIQTNKAPISITGQSGQVTATPPQRITTHDEADKSLLAKLIGNFK